MGDGVKWDIDVDADPSSAKTTDSVLEKMDRHLKSVDHHAGKLGDSIGKVGHESKKAGEHAHGMFGEMLKAELAKDLIEKLIEKVVELGREALHTAANQQRMRGVFTNAAGGNEELGRANEEFADIVAKRTELTEDMTEGAFLDLKGVGADDKEAKFMMKAAADVAAVSRNKEEAFEATIGAFKALERTGTISPRMLGALGLGVKDFKTLPSMHGMSTKAIKKQMEEGKVDRNDLFRLIMSRSNETMIGQKAADSGDLFGSKLKNLSSLPEQFYKKMADTRALKAMSGAIDLVLSKLDPDSPTGKKISGFMETVFNAGADVLSTLTGAIERIDFDEVATTVKEDLVPGIKAAIGAIQPMVDIVERVVRGFHRMAEIISDVDSGIKAVGLKDRAHFSEGPEVAAARAARREQAEAAAAVSEKTVDLGKGTKAHHGAFQIVGKAAAAGLANGIGGGFSMVDDVASQLAERAVTATKAELKVKSPSVVFEDIGAMTAAGYVQGLEGGGHDVDDALAAMLSRRAVPGRDRAGSGGGGISLSFGDVYIQVDGGRDGAEQGRRAADSFKKHVRSEVLSLLEQMRAEAGA